MAIRYIGDANSQSKIKGAVDGVASPAGYIGEVIPFTTRAITITNSGTWYNSGAGNQLCTLTAGVWLLFLWGNGGTASSVYAVNLGTGTSGNTGSILTQNGTFTQPTGAVIGQFQAPITTYVATGASTPLYAMAYSLSASTTASLNGVAVRIA